MNREHTRAEIYNGKSVLERLADVTFCQQWDSLYAACSWATALQSRHFAEIWYSVYSSVFEPLIIYAKDDAGNLSGLFALAININTRKLVYVGADQAEYQVWLSSAEEGDTFIESALDQLAIQFPKSRLNLRFLPANSPLDWLNPSRRWAKQVYCKSVARPLMSVGENSSIEESLRKKSNKSRISRLGKLGAVRLDVLRSRQDIEPIFDRIIELCNFRNSARYQNIPFQDDPLKKEFYLRLVDAPDIIHTSVFRAGDEILAANIGSRDKSSVQVGLVTQSPFVSEHSPGKFLLLFLGREICAEGFSDLDLTPNGSSDLGYKQRFADHCDTAYICSISLGGRANARLNNTKFRLIELVKFCLMQADISHESIRLWQARVKQLVNGNKPVALFMKTMQWLVRRIYSDTQLDFYSLNADEVGQIDDDTRFHRDSLSDLLLYEPATPDDHTKFDFLGDVYARLTAGSHVFTVTDGNKLLHSAWLNPIVTDSITTDMGSKIDLIKGSVMLWDDAIRDEELYQASIRVRLREAVTMLKGGKIFISVANDNESARQIIECIGFHGYATVVRRFRCGSRSTNLSLRFNRLPNSQ